MVKDMRSKYDFTHGIRGKYMKQNLKNEKQISFRCSDEQKKLIETAAKVSEMTMNAICRRGVEREARRLIEEFAMESDNENPSR